MLLWWVCVYGQCTRKHEMARKRSTKVPWKSNKMWHKTILLNVDKTRRKKEENEDRKYVTKTHQNRQGKRNWTASSEINGWVVEPSSAPYIQYMFQNYIAEIYLRWISSVYNSVLKTLSKTENGWRTSEMSLSFNLCLSRCFVAITTTTRKSEAKMAKPFTVLYRNWCICLEKHNPKLLR